MENRENLVKDMMKLLAVPLLAVALALATLIDRATEILKKKAHMIPLVILTAFLFLACSASAVSASDVNIDENFGHFTLYGAGDSVVKLGSDLHATSVRVYGDRIRFENAYLGDNPDTASTFTFGIDPSADKPLHVVIRKMDADAGEGETALRMNMWDATHQSMDLTVRGLSGNAEYVLYEDGTVIARDTTTSGGRWNGSIHDVGSTYELVRSKTGTTIPIIPPEKELNIKIRTGHYKKGRFVPTTEFNAGEKVTVVAHLSTDESGVSHGEVNGFWNGNPFAFEDRVGNKFVGTFTIPEGTKPGSYLVSVTASADGHQTKASKSITVGRAGGLNVARLLGNYWWLIAIIVIILLLIALS